MDPNNLKGLIEAYKKVNAPQPVEELYKGKHGQTEKEYQDSRSDAGKMISGDSKRSGAAYSSRAVKNTGPNPAGGSERPKAQGRMGAKDRAYLQYRKANLKKEEVEQIDEISANLALTASQKADEERRKAAVAGDKERAAAKAQQASRLYKGVGPRRAKERMAEGARDKKNDGNLANNYPPYDKVTRGDVIAGATGKDQMGGKRKVKEDLEASGLFTAKEIEAILEADLNEADSIAKMRERAAKRRQQRYGKQGGGGRDDFRPYTKDDYERGEKKK